MSDTHCIHDKMRYSVPEGDVLVHAGDFTSTEPKSRLRTLLIGSKSFRTNIKL